MKIELVSIGLDGDPNWIEVRDKIKGGDIFAVHEASEIPLDEEGRTSAISYQGLDDTQFAALAQRLITAWSFQVPLPGSAAAAKSVISDLEEDDFWKLHAALRPMLDKIKAGGPVDPKNATYELTQWLIDRHLRPRNQAAFQLPAHFPTRMLTYDQFADERGWDPRVVDELTDDELFWLPVIRAAKADAAAQLSDK